MMGDFNEVHAGPVHRCLDTEFPLAKRRMRTHPSPLPLFALDRLVWDAPLDGTLRVVPVAGASDHRMLHARLQ